MKTKYIYQEALINQLNNCNQVLEFNDELKINIYLTLLALNNNNYNDSIYTNEINIIENYLRKTNNLKVKIQLKRQEQEINNLLNEIKTIYHDNKNLIEKYNKEHLKIINIINTLDDKQITNVIDKLTKEKIRYQDNKKYYDETRKEIIENIWHSNYKIINEYIHIDNLKTKKNIIISKKEFTDIFDYLLNINNYKHLYINEKTDKLHIDLINQIISLIHTKRKPNNEIIPIVLTYLIFQNNKQYDKIDASNFNIENIKISDLYSFVKEKTSSNQRLLKWKNILIPNEYLHNKIKKSSINGQYYFKDNNFIIENINNTINDFKLSINIESMKTFLKESIENIIK